MEARVGIEPSRPIANTQVIDFNYSSFGNIWEILKQIGGSRIKMSNLRWWVFATFTDSIVSDCPYLYI